MAGGPPGQFPPMVRKKAQEKQMPMPAQYAARQGRVWTTHQRLRVLCDTLRFSLCLLSSVIARIRIVKTYSDIRRQ